MFSHTEQLHMSQNQQPRMLAGSQVRATKLARTEQKMRIKEKPLTVCSRASLQPKQRECWRDGEEEQKVSSAARLAAISKQTHIHSEGAGGRGEEERGWMPNQDVNMGERGEGRIGEDRVTLGSVGEA
ncbi:hypothetical protein CHARACLAT_027501 [Characodon lateralis]|uniref:Uncharacterized protein n=1 Tax=Characodon lateralis TaxID=208331 RepID=A0ABU7DK90_9TELE|nr:hypothetical protein [Characodon lateralis]